MLLRWPQDVYLKVWNEIELNLAGDRRCGILLMGVRIESIYRSYPGGKGKNDIVECAFPTPGPMEPQNLKNWTKHTKNDSQFGILRTNGSA